jgi:hypothetical protein
MRALQRSAVVSCTASLALTLASPADGGRAAAKRL